MLKKALVFALLVLCKCSHLTAGTLEKIDSVLNLHSKQTFINYMDKLSADGTIAYWVYKDYDLTPKHKCLQLYFTDVKDKEHPTYVSEVVYIKDVIHFYNFNNYQQISTYKANNGVNRLESLSIWKGTTKFFHNPPEVFGFGGSVAGPGFDWMEDGIKKGTITYDGLITWLYIKQPVLNAFALDGLYKYNKLKGISPGKEHLARINQIKNDQTLITEHNGCVTMFNTPVAGCVRRYTFE